MYSCKLQNCARIFNDHKLYIRHLRLIHALTNIKSSLLCGVQNCDAQCNTYSGLTKHIVSKHKTIDVISNITQNLNSNLSNDLSSSSIINNVSNCDADGISQNLDQELLDKLMTLNLNYTQTNVILESIASFTQLIEINIRKKLLLCEHHNTINELLQPEFNILRNPFKLQKSTYLRKKNIFSKVPLPREIALGVRSDRTWNRQQNIFDCQRPVTNSFSYVSIIETLGFLCQNENFTSKILKNSLAENNLLHYTRCTYFKQNKLFMSEPCFHLQLYFDEFEVVNPLGSKTGVHKVLAIYLTILNLGHSNNSLLKNIHLVALCHNADVKQYGYDSILEPIVNDLKILESEGIIVQYKEALINLKGTIYSLSHDNLSANSLYGLHESFSSNYFCRFCRTHRKDINKSLIFEEKILRNKNDYDLYVVSREFGLQKNCALNNLQYFNTFESNSVDIMHDLLEGVGQYELKLFLLYLTKESKLISIEDVNKRIKNANFGYLNRSNIPSLINFESKTKNLKQSASQFWCLLRHFPILIHDIIEKGNSDFFNKFNVILLLIKITNIIFSPESNSETNERLKILIIEHHTEFISKFPGHNVIPKHHLILHYYTIIQKMGTLTNMWTMRYEGKHAKFKEMARTSRNFKNMTKLLALKHQQTIYINYEKNKFDKELEFKVEKRLVFNTLNLKLKNLNSSFNFMQNDEINIIKEIKYGFLYKKNFIICIVKKDPLNSELPIFGSIEYIIENKGEIYFIYHLLKTICFNYNLNAFETNCINELNVKKLESLEFRPLEYCYHTNSSNKFLIPKYEII